MFLNHIKNVPKNPITVEGGKNTNIQWLLTKEDGFDHINMRYITIKPGGVVPVHRHEVIHAIFIIRGSGILFSDTGEKRVETGNFIYVDSNEGHGFKNESNENLEFVTTTNIPKSGDMYK